MFYLLFQILTRSPNCCCEKKIKTPSLKKKLEILPRLATSNVWLHKNRSVLNNKESSPSLVNQSIINLVRESKMVKSKGNKINKLFQRRGNIVAQRWGLLEWDLIP